MGAIGRWIDEKCAAEPDVMRRVLNRKWNDLKAFIERHPCPRGCMIGTYVLVKHPEAMSVGLYVDAETKQIGLDPVISLKNRLGHPAAVRLLKQRIRKALGLAPVRGLERGSGVPTPQEQPQ